MQGIYRLLTLTFCLAVSALWLDTAQAASFDCAKARTKVEKMICANKDLSNWDDLMAQGYKLDRIFPGQEKWTKKTQLKWLKRRNQCRNIECLKKAYLDRIYALNNPPGHDGKWINSPYNEWSGQNSALCRGLLKWVNSFSWQNDQCLWSVIANYPGFTQPPWKELNPRKNIDLLYKLLAVSNFMFYQKIYNGGKPLNPIPISNYRDRAGSFIRNGGKMLVWHARILDYYGDRFHPVPPGKQTIVELRYYADGDPMALKECPGKPKQQWWGMTYIVSPDLSGPDPHITPSIVSRLSAGVILLNKNEMYLDSPEGVFTKLMVPAFKTLGIPPTYCEYRFKEFKKGDKQ